MDWISVKDSLPPLTPNEAGVLRLPSDDCLVYTEHHDILTAAYTVSGEWVERHGTSCGCCAEDIEVTHWQPLPRAPA